MALNGIGKPYREAIYNGNIQCHRARESDVLHAKTYRYDNYSRLKFTETKIKRANSSTSDIYTQFTQFDNNFDRVTHVGLPDGLTLENVYRSNGFVEQVRNANDTNRVYTNIMSMDAFGNVTMSVQDNGVETTKNYNPLNGRLDNLSIDGIRDTQGNFYRQYQYDLIGNLTHQFDQTNSLLEEYSYDDVNRIKSFSLQGTQLQSYTYDCMGNIRSKSDVGDHYAYGLNNTGVHAVSAIGRGGIIRQSFNYDANGNMTKTIYHRENSIRNISYAAFDKPLSISKGTTQIDFAYAADRSRYRRIDSKNNGAIKIDTTYLDKSFEHIRYTGGDKNGQTEYKFFIGDTVITDTVYRNGVNQTKSQYLHRDHLGSVVAITDEARQAKRYRYDPFGQQYEVLNNSLLGAAEVTKAQQMNRGFTGHEMLSDFGLIHMNGRIYDPLIARFVQADPYIQSPNHSQNLNRYSYVMNNPMNAIEPSGFFFKNIVNSAFKVVDGIVKFINRKPALRVLGQLTAAYFDTIGCLGYCSVGFASASTYQATGSLNSALSAGARTMVTNILAAPFSGGATTINSVLGRVFFGGISSVLNGGKFGHGFASAGLTKILNINTIVKSVGIKWSALRVTASAIIGGTVSKLTGDKFKNGALSGAFSQTIRETKIGFHSHGDSRHAAAGEPEGAVDGPMVTVGQWRITVVDEVAVGEIRYTCIGGTLTCMESVARVEKTFNKSKYINIQFIYDAKNPELTFESNDRIANAGEWHSYSSAIYMNYIYSRPTTWNHEIGHALGFRHRFNSSGSIMSYAENRAAGLSDAQAIKLRDKYNRPIPKKPLIERFFNLFN